MAILSINEFTERVELNLVLCERCRGCMQEAEVNKLDALLFIFGIKKIPRRYKCQDCGLETKK